MAKCSVTGCDNEVVAKGYCMKHYRRFRRHGSVERVKPLWKGKTCKAEGCSEPAKIHGYCGKHYRRIENRGTPDEPHFAYRDMCSVPGCTEHVRCKGLCYKHYYAHRYRVRTARNKAANGKPKDTG